MGGTLNLLKRISLTSWIFIGMVAGILIGQLWPGAGKELGILSTIFLRLIKSIIAPLLFATLVHGIASVGDIKTMGRIGVKAIIYFEIVTTIALVIGLATVNVARPGVGMTLQKGAGEVAAMKADTSIKGILEHTFPASIIDAMAKGEVLQLVVFCFIFGIACTAAGDRAKPMIEWCESLAEVMFKYTGYVMYFAPFGVGGAIAATVADKGLGVLFNLGQLVLTLFAALCIFVFVVLGAVMVLTKVPIHRFWQHIREPYLLAFATASSESALPLALKRMEKFGVPEHIVAFVLPTGYSFNLDGSTLYLSLASVFVAQAAGVDLPLSTQILMMLTLMLTSKGVAGVPRASLVILSGTLATFNLPLEGIAVILGVDTIMDMMRTSVNLLGNCLASAVVARWEGVTFPRELSTDLERI